MINDQIAARIQAIRKEGGMTQNDLAKYISKSPATLSDIERGKIQVSAADLFQIANALNTPIEVFFGEMYDSEEIKDLIILIRKQSPENQKSIVQQIKTLLSLNKLQDVTKIENRELTDEEIQEAISNIFSYADEFEQLNNHLQEIRNNLKKAFHTNK